MNIIHKNYGEVSVIEPDDAGLTWVVDEEKIDCHVLHLPFDIRKPPKLVACTRGKLRIPMMRMSDFDRFALGFYAVNCAATLQSKFTVEVVYVTAKTDHDVCGVYFRTQKRPGT